MASTGGNSLLLRLLGIGLLAIAAFFTCRALVGGEGLGVPARLLAFGMVPLAMVGILLVEAHRLFGTRAPAFDWKSFWAGGASLAAGLFLMEASIVDPRDDAFNGPRWLVTVGGLIFVLAGIAVIRQATGMVRAGGDAAGVLLVVMLFTCFGAMSTWVAFGPGRREFEGGVSIPFFDFSLGSEEVQGRILFGIAAVILDAIALAAWGAAGVGLWKWWRGRRG